MINVDHYENDNKLAETLTRRVPINNTKLLKLNGIEVYLVSEHPPG